LILEANESLPSYLTLHLTQSHLSSSSSEYRSSHPCSSSPSTFNSASSARSWSILLDFSFALSPHDFRLVPMVLRRHRLTVNSLGEKCSTYSRSIIDPYSTRAGLGKSSHLHSFHFLTARFLQETMERKSMGVVFFPIATTRSESGQHGINLGNKDGVAFESSRAGCMTSWKYNEEHFLIGRPERIAKLAVARKGSAIHLVGDKARLNFFHIGLGFDFVHGVAGNADQILPGRLVTAIPAQ